MGALVLMPWDVKDVTGLRGMLNLSQNVSRPFKANMPFGYVSWLTLGGLHSV